jgi:hypothetical protein
MKKKKKNRRKKKKKNTKKEQEKPEEDRLRRYRGCAVVVRVDGAHANERLRGQWRQHNR